MEVPINEKIILNGTTTGNGTFIGIVPLNWVETHRGLTIFYSFLSISIAITISLYNIYGHLRNYTCPNLQRYIVRILVIIPMYSLGSFLSLKFIKYAIYFDIIRDCYEAFVVYSFLVLVIAYAGGESACVSKMPFINKTNHTNNTNNISNKNKTTKYINKKESSNDHDKIDIHTVESFEKCMEMSHPFPFNYCFPPLGRDGRLLRGCKKGTLQFVIIKPVFAFISFILLLTNQYESIMYQAILILVYNTSYSFALYCLVLFYMATKHILIKFNPVLKFFAVKGIIFLTYWQQLMISTIPNITNEQYMVWKDLIVSIEMIGFSILYLFAFNSYQYRTKMNEKETDSEIIVKNMKEVLSIKDIVADAYHNFMPSYQDYILQRSEDDSIEKDKLKDIQDLDDNDDNIDNNEIEKDKINRNHSISDIDTISKDSFDIETKELNNEKKNKKKTKEINNNNHNTLMNEKKLFSTRLNSEKFIQFIRTSWNNNNNNNNKTLDKTQENSDI